MPWQDSKRSFPHIAARFVKVRQKRLLFFLLHIYLFPLYLVETDLSNYISSFSWSLSWTILVICDEEKTELLIYQTRALQ